VSAAARAVGWGSPVCAVYMCVSWGNQGDGGRVGGQRGGVAASEWALGGRAGGAQLCSRVGRRGDSGGPGTCAAGTPAQ
jgi:hypothetical protein